MKRAEAIEYFKRYGGRAGLSQRCLEIAREIVECNSYKRAMAGAGQMTVLAEIAQKADSYWGEMVHRGRTPEMDCAGGLSMPVLGVEGYVDHAKTKAKAHAQPAQAEGVR